MFTHNALTKLYGLLVGVVVILIVYKWIVYVFYGFWRAPLLSVAVAVTSHETPFLSYWFYSFCHSVCIFYNVILVFPCFTKINVVYIASHIRVFQWSINHRFTYFLSVSNTLYSSLGGNVFPFFAYTLV